MENTLRKSPWSAKSSIKSNHNLLKYLVCVAQRSNNVFCQAIIIKDYNKSQLKLALDKSAKPKEFKKEFKLQWIYDYENTPRRIPHCYILKKNKTKQIIHYFKINGVAQGHKGSSKSLMQKFNMSELYMLTFKTTSTWQHTTNKRMKTILMLEFS